MTRRILLAIAIALGIAALPAAAVAAPGWTAPRNFALPANTFIPSLVMAYGPGGTATIAYDEVLSFSPAVTVLHVGVIPPGGTYHEQLRIPTTSISIPLQASIAEAPNGATAVAWYAQEGTGSSLMAYYATYRAAGHTAWSVPSVLASNTITGNGTNPQLVTAIGPNGTAAVGIDRYDPGIIPINGSDHDTYLAEVIVHGPSGSWGIPTEISPPATSSRDLALGVDGQGNVTAAFRVKLSNGRHTLGVVRRAASNGIWGSLEDVTGSDITSDLYAPQLAVAANGSAVIAFQYDHFAAPNTLDVTAVTRVGATGAWTAPGDLAVGGAYSVPGHVGIAPNGRAYVLYSYGGTNSGLNCEGIARTQAGSAFPTTPRCLSAANFQNAGGVGINFLGNDAYFFWYGEPNAGSQWVVESSRWLNGAAAPEAPTNLDAPSSTEIPHAFLPDQQGGVAAFWQTVSTQLRVAAFDAGGPSVAAAAIPTRVRAGRAALMSVTFADLWSGVSGRAQWNFGDHKAATGTRVRHTYRKAGRYTVRITAKDRLGNVRTVTYRILVTRH